MTPTDQTDQTLDQEDVDPILARLGIFGDGHRQPDGTFVVEVWPDRETHEVNIEGPGTVVGALIGTSRTGWADAIRDLIRRHPQLASEPDRVDEAIGMFERYRRGRRQAAE